MEEKVKSRRGSTIRSSAKKMVSGVPKVSAISSIPARAVAPNVAQLLSRHYLYKYTTGPFCLPLSTHSLDWGILNNDPLEQEVRVTVFKCSIGSDKTAEPPGPLSITIEPGRITHNANAASGGFYYEIQVECNSEYIFPYASAWPGAIGDPIPGTVVKSAEFIRKLQ